MTIDEAISHAREVASEQKRRSGECVQDDSERDKLSTCLECAKEHEQIAEWLEELKRYRDTNFICIHLDIDSDEVKRLIADARIKAIDDFYNEIKKIKQGAMDISNTMLIEFVEMPKAAAVKEQLKKKYLKGANL